MVPGPPAVPRRATDDPLSPPRRRDRGGARSPAHLSAWSRRREEVEAGLTRGAREVEAKIGVGEGDGEAGEDALVDLGLAGADEAAELLGAVAYQGVRAVLQRGYERGQIVVVRAVVARLPCAGRLGHPFEQIGGGTNRGAITTTTR